MNRLMHRLSPVLGALLFMLPGILLHGEVSVQVDGNNEFHSLNKTTKTVSHGTEYWSRTTSLPDKQVVNPSGDAKGDRAPVSVVTSNRVGEVCTTANDMAYVVWEHFDGSDYELYYATFAKEAWTSMAPVVIRDDSADDRQPSLAAYNGRVYLVWWKDDEIPGVYYSKYSCGWTSPELISEPDKDSREPTIQINTRQEVVITYKVYIDDRPTTTTLIRETIDPFDY